MTTREVYGSQIYMATTQFLMNKRFYSERLYIVVLTTKPTEMYIGLYIFHVFICTMFAYMYIPRPDLEITVTPRIFIPYTQYVSLFLFKFVTV